MEANDAMNNNYKRLTIVNIFKKHTIDNKFSLLSLLIGSPIVMFGFYIAVLIATAQEVEFTAAPHTKSP